MDELIIKTIDIPIFRGKFSVCVGFGEYDLPEIYKTTLEEEDFRKVYSAHSFLLNIQESDDLPRECFLIALNLDHKYRKITPGDISHEASHIAKFICKERGIIADHDNDECEAYIIGWIVDEIHKIFRDNNINIIV